jgi:hypothetical protein
VEDYPLERATECANVTNCHVDPSLLLIAQNVRRTARVVVLGPSAFSRRVFLSIVPSAAETGEDAQLNHLFPLLLAQDIGRFSVTAEDQNSCTYIVFTGAVTATQEKSPFGKGQSRQTGLVSFGYFVVFDLPFHRLLV